MISSILQLQLMFLVWPVFVCVRMYFLYCTYSQYRISELLSIIFQYWAIFTTLTQEWTMGENMVISKHNRIELHYEQLNKCKTDPKKIAPGCDSYW